MALNFEHSPECIASRNIYSFQNIIKLVKKNKAQLFAHQTLFCLPNMKYCFVHSDILENLQ